jgi:hypothetical protein
MSTVARPHTSIPDAPPLRRRLTPPMQSPPPARRHFVRRRLALAGGLLGVALAIAAALVLASRGSGEAPPATGAAAVVPANALAYVSLSTDSARPAVGRARRLAARFPDWPLLATAALNRLDSMVGGSSSTGFAAIRPWLGKEASLALLAAPDGSAAPLIVLDVARRARAQVFLTDAGAGAGAGATPAGAYAGVRLFANPSGTEFAFVGGHYLAVGSDAVVRGAIDAAHGRVRSLAHDTAYERAAAGEPSDRMLDAYLPAAGVRRLLAPRTGVAGALAVLLDRPGVAGTSISLSPRQDGARVLVHSVLSAPAARPSSFAPTLQSVLPSGSTLMLDVAGLDRAAPTILRATATAGIAGSVGPLLRRLGTALVSQGVDVGRLISLFSGETAVAISPGTPAALLIVARVRDEAAARSELAAVEAPLTSLFSSSSSSAIQVPELADSQVNGATVHELQLGPGLQLDFGVFNGLLVVSTSVAAIDAVAQRSRPLAEDSSFKATLSDRPHRLSSLVFLDFSRLLALGEQMGLAGGARTRELLPDLSKIRAIGVSSTSRGNDTTTELSLKIP